MKRRVPSFKIANKYLCSVLDVKPMRFVTEDGLTIEGTAQTFIDHPKFTDLRKKLEKLGYIKIEPRWWNGDRVLTKFKFNDMVFGKGEPFPCASALAIRLQVKKKVKK